MWEINRTGEFDDLWETWDEQVQNKMTEIIEILEEKGPLLARPYADAVYGSRHSNMKELRVQVSGKPWRIFFVFDPNQEGILLIGGTKQGDDRFMETMVPIADGIYDTHLAHIKKRAAAQKSAASPASKKKK